MDEMELSSATVVEASKDRALLGEGIFIIMNLLRNH